MRFVEQWFCRFKKEAGGGLNFSTTGRKYDALPDRRYLVGRDGRIVYRGPLGPFGFIVADLERAIERYLAETGRGSGYEARSSKEDSIKAAISSVQHSS
jgi:hypothetical protein